MVGLLKESITCQPGRSARVSHLVLMRQAKRGTMDKVIEALENLITELVNDDGISYEEALKRIQDALAKLS